MPAEQNGNFATTWWFLIMALKRSTLALIVAGLGFIAWDYTHPASLDSLDYPAVTTLFGGLFLGLGLGRMLEQR